MALVKKVVVLFRGRHLLRVSPLSDHGRVCWAIDPERPLMPQEETAHLFVKEKWE
ncbi:MAG: hypothetical protein PHP75_00020 [Methylacidiphilaceae bacterium]|nr:hypothetical protein [Candidatus Methylacidiphilaceae bacterium]